MMAKNKEIEAVALAIHDECAKIGVCGENCDHTEEARAGIRAYLREIRKSKKPSRGGA